MLVVGLTGGIGSGKTTVAKLFEKLGATIIDTDQLARDVTEPNQIALQKMGDHFGSRILKADGSLNRTELRKIVFDDEKERTWLEQLLHPLIREEMKRKIETAQTPYCIVIIPLLFETEPNPLIDRILVVDTSENEQIKRTQTRDNITADEVKAILKTQVNRTERLSSAHDVIINEGPLKDLIPQVERLHDFYTNLAKKTFIK